MPSQNERFWSKVEKTPTCWLWNGAKNWQGYGCFDGNSAQRYSISQSNGVPIPKGLTVDHLCRVRACVNPKHLEIVTLKENILRSRGLAAVNASKHHCNNGH